MILCCTLWSMCNYMCLIFSVCTWMIFCRHHQLCLIELINIMYIMEETVAPQRKKWDLSPQMQSFQLVKIIQMKYCLCNCLLLMKMEKACWQIPSYNVRKSRTKLLVSIVTMLFWFYRYQPTTFSWTYSNYLIIGYTTMPTSLPDKWSAL